MTAEFSSWVKQQGGFGNVIGDMIAKFVDFILPQPFKWIVDNMTAKFTNKDDSAVNKTSTGWTAQFTKGKVSIKQKDKKVRGLTGIVTKIKDSIKNKNLSNFTAGLASATDNISNKRMTGFTAQIDKVETSAGVDKVLQFGLKLNKKGASYVGATMKPISQFANGGMPNHGTAFIAGEHGAEIVGHVGNRTEVLNQSQLASTMYSAVVAAMTQVHGSGQQPIQVLLDGKVVFDNTRQRANEYFRKTGNPAFSC